MLPTSENLLKHYGKNKLTNESACFFYINALERRLHIGHTFSDVTVKWSVSSILLMLALTLANSEFHFW
ncbi:unnamed protein product [Calicophoron daubneyi]|uniref:Uncharacterized protein n=1 Tax=Calicophoron daubneyi TaxID=300641 RepID=A0AAV2THF9_CALDB